MPYQAPQKGRKGKEKGTHIYPTPSSYLPCISLVFILTASHTAPAPAPKRKETGISYALFYSGDKVIIYK